MGETNVFGTAFHGSKSSIGATAVQLTTVDTPIQKGVTIKADVANSGTVYVGNSSDVTADGGDGTTGFALEGGSSLTVELDNLDRIYLIGSASGQKIFFWGN